LQAELVKNGRQWVDDTNFVVQKATPQLYNLVSEFSGAVSFNDCEEIADVWDEGE
jgi:hypothetical protein